MFRHPLKPKNLLKFQLAALLTITLSGVYYLVCCPEIYSAGSGAGHHAAGMTAGNGHCNFFKKKSSETSFAAAGLNASKSCALKFNFYVAKLEKKELPQNSPASAHNFFNFLGPVKLEYKTGFTGFSDRAPLFDKGALHIKNCVFRI